jgi:hypothetical protein
MTTSGNLEYCLLQYLPNLLSDKSVSIAALFIESSDLENGFCTLSLAAEWRTKVRLLDPDADLEMLGALLREIRDRLCSPGERSEVINQLEHSFSNVIQVSRRQQCPVIPSPKIIEAFARDLLEGTSTMSHHLSQMQPQHAPAPLDRNFG